jgi:hypothetical protein
MRRAGGYIENAFGRWIGGVFDDQLWSLDSLNNARLYRQVAFSWIGILAIYKVFQGFQGEGVPSLRIVSAYEAKSVLVCPRAWLKGTSDSTKKHDLIKGGL